MFCLWDLARFLVLLLVSSASAFAQDPGWPRKLEKPGGTVIVYQPQVDEWKDYATITTRVAFQLTPIGGKQVIGAATMMGNSNVDKDKHMVVIYGIKVTDAFFPSLDETTSAKMEQLFRTLVPEVVNIPAQQQRQTTRQNRPSTPQPNSAATQQHSQYSNQTRSSSSTSTQNLNSEIQSRQRGTSKPILTSAPLPAVAALGAQAAQAVLDAARPSRVQSRGKSSSPQIPQISGGLDEFTSLDCYF